MSERDSQLKPLAELAKQLPAVRGSKPPNRTTLYRWATKGLKSGSGQYVLLPTQFVGGTRCATIDDLGRFFEAKKDAEWTPPPMTRTQAEIAAMHRRAEAANNWLDKRGF